MKEIIRPENKWDLIKFIKKEVGDCGWSADLNHLDVSELEDLSGLFSESYGIFEFNGDISKWDVGRVRNMNRMFEFSRFRGDIANWDVGGVLGMKNMFAHSLFNGNLSRWNISGVKEMQGMFKASEFGQPLEDWVLNEQCDTTDMFKGCALWERLLAQRDVSIQAKSDFEVVRALWRKNFLHERLIEQIEEQPKKIRL